jgi:hypothetical protein
MIKVIGRLMVQCPESMEAIFALAGIMGATVPAVPPALATRTARIRAHLRDKPSVVVRMPQTIYALTTITPLKALTRAAASGAVTDYSTHIMTMRVLMGFYAYRMGDLRGGSAGTPRRLWFKMAEKADVLSLCRGPTFGVRAQVPEEYIARQVRVTDENRSATGAISSLLGELESRAMVVSVGEQATEFRDHIAMALSIRLARRVNLKIHGLPNSILLDQASGTDDERMNNTIRFNAYLEVARMNIRNPTARASLEEKAAFLMRLEELADELPGFMNNSSYHGGLYDGSFEAYVAARDVSTMAAVGNRKATVMGDLSSPQVYRETVSSAIRDMYGNLFSTHHEWTWNDRLVLNQRQDGRPVMLNVPGRQGGMRFKMDDILDGLTAILASIRPSEHRATPYNQMTYRIQFLKLMTISMRWMGIHGEDGMNSGTPKAESENIFAAAALTREELPFIRAAIHRELGPDHQHLLTAPLGPTLAKRASVYGRMRHSIATYRFRGFRGQDRFVKIMDLAMAAQTFLNNCITCYLTNHVVHVTADILRSTEVSDIMTGRWQMQAVRMATIGSLVPSEAVVTLQAANLLAANMTILRLHNLVSMRAVALQLSVGREPDFSLQCIAALGRHNIVVLEAGDEPNEPISVTFEVYPGEEEQEVGHFYTVVYYSESAAELVTRKARLGSMAEMVADIVETADGFALIAAVAITSEPPDLGSDEESLVGSQAETGSNVSMLSQLDESDARHLVHASLLVASQRRQAEAGLVLSAEDPISLSISTELAGNTGIGSSRRGGWEGRILPGEVGLAASVALSGHGSSPLDRLRGAALAWVSLRHPANTPPGVLAQAAGEMLNTWAAACSPGSPLFSMYSIQGVYAEISGILTWLGHQNFRLPIEDEIPSAVLEIPAGDVRMLYPSVNQTLRTRFTTAEVPLADVRAAADVVGSFAFLPHYLVPNEPLGRLDDANPANRQIPGQLILHHLDDISEASDET